MDAYNTINDILVHLFNEIWELEKKAIITEEFKDITNNDMHIIEAIGVSGKTTMSVVAKKMKITAGSLTTAVNGLVNKKYVMRARGEGLLSSRGVSQGDDKCCAEQTGRKRDSGSYEDIGRTFRIFQGLFFRGIK